MWHYGAPYPEIKIEPLPEIPWLKHKVYSDIFIGMGSQTGTYIETNAHYFKDEKKLSEIPLERLFMADAAVLNLERKGPKEPIRPEEITALNPEIHERDAILFGTGWGQRWREANFVKDSPYLTYDAMMWFLDRKPSILGGDIPVFDNPDNPQGFWDKFFRSGALLLAPLVNLEKVRKRRVKLVALPLNVEGTCSAPCRTIVVED
jgi:kynurenine formamidase